MVSEALRRTLAVRPGPTSLLVHSDQGSPYTATAFQDLLARHGAVQSRSRRGNYYNNAHADSFWSRFKAELPDGGSFPNLESARPEISHYVSYYNAKRHHSTLGYVCPQRFESHFQTTSQIYPA